MSLATPVSEPRLSGWNRFWFTPADPTTLSLIRVIAGVTIFLVHVAYCFDLQELFGRDSWVNTDLVNSVRLEMPVAGPPLGWQFEPRKTPEQLGQIKVDEYVQKWGVHPALAETQGQYSWSIWFHVTHPTAMQLIHGFNLTVMFLFAVGFATRATSVLTWVAVLQYVNRTPTILFGMDQMMVILATYLMIGPSGAYFSVDRWLSKRGYSWAQWLGGSPAPSVAANLALRLMQVHMCFIYTAAGLAKLLGSTWWGGTALWYGIANYEFSWIRQPIYAGALRWVSQHRWLWESLMSFCVIYTLVLQISFPYLVWQKRFRWALISGAILLHTMISTLMGLLGFGLCMFALVLAFIPGNAVRAVLRMPSGVSDEAAKADMSESTTAVAA